MVGQLRGGGRKRSGHGRFALATETIHMLDWNAKNEVYENMGVASQRYVENAPVDGFGGGDSVNVLTNWLSRGRQLTFG